MKNCSWSSSCVTSRLYSWISATPCSAMSFVTWIPSVAYAEIFHGGISFSGRWWSFAFDVHCLWRHNLTSYSCFQTNLLAKFVDIICIFFYIHSPYFMCHFTEYQLLLALKVRISEVNTLNATTQQFITAKISGYALKQGSKTYSPMRQRNLHLQNETAL